MRILLANPPSRFDVSLAKERFFVRAGSRWPFSTIKPKDEPLGYVPFPFYLAYTAALLEKGGFDVRVIDSVALNQTGKDFLEQVKKLVPDVILFETSTPTINHDLEIAAQIKLIVPRIKVCLAGPHVTIFPRQTLQTSRHVDYVFCQEYELNFRDFCQLLRSGHKDLSSIQGIGWRTAEGIKINSTQLIDPLDQLPSPAWHLFPSNDRPDINVYWDGFCQSRPAVQLHSSRGCPFRCNFCLWNQVMYRNGKYRTFSAQRVVEEMASAQKRFGAKEVYFDDDTFTGNRQHVLNICREIKRRELKINWSVMGDAMISDGEMITQMAASGCVGMKFGVESGNRQILRHIQKPIKFEKLKQVASLCARNKIKTHATFTFGLSGETKQSMRDSLNLAKALDVDSVQFSITTPFPGTRYYDEVKKQGLLLARQWEDYDGSSNSVVRFENLEADYIATVCRRASGIWLKDKIKHPRWLFRQVRYFGRIIKGQGVGAVAARVKRGWQLLTLK